MLVMENSVSETTEYFAGAYSSFHFVFLQSLDLDNIATIALLTPPFPPSPPASPQTPNFVCAMGKSVTPFPSWSFSYQI